jgi:hypothetical protein
MLFTIKRVSVFGDKVILNNSSQWVIPESHRGTSQQWCETQVIAVKEVDATQKLYQLVNLDTSQVAEAVAVNYP